jgi:hypothetical protein
MDMAEVRLYMATFIPSNDFNNAIILDWNYTGNSYCLDFHNLSGTFNAPEEHLGLWTVDGRIDVFAMGSVIFTLLTGLYPYWEYHSEERHRMIRDGIGPNLDDRYRTPGTVESKMVHVLEECWTYEAEKRPEIFQVVQWLKQIQSVINSK